MDTGLSIVILMLSGGNFPKVEEKIGSDDDDGFAKWMSEDDEKNRMKRHGSLFRMPTPPSTASRRERPS